MRLSVDTTLPDSTPRPASSRSEGTAPASPRAWSSRSSFQSRMEEVEHRRAAKPHRALHDEIIKNYMRAAESFEKADLHASNVRMSALDALNQTMGKGIPENAEVFTRDRGNFREIIAFLPPLPTQTVRSAVTRAMGRFPRSHQHQVTVQINDRSARAEGVAENVAFTDVAYFWDGHFYLDGVNPRQSATRALRHKDCEASTTLYSEPASVRAGNPVLIAVATIPLDDAFLDAVFLIHEGKDDGCFLAHALNLIEPYYRPAESTFA